MKLTFSIIGLETILIGSAVAATVPLEKIGEPFYCEKLQVEWKVATNDLPSTVTIFKVVPTSFSPTVISNMVRLGSFASADRVRSVLLAMLFPKSVTYRNSDESVSLSITPSHGLISFQSEGDFTTPSENVPSQTRAFELGTNILTQLELSAGQLQTGSELQPRAWFYPGTRGRGDKQTHKLIVEPWSMGVEFRRMLDDIRCDNEHLHIQFESRERIARLDLCWHGVKALKRYPVATKEEIMMWIKEGRARVGYSVMTGARWIKMSEIKRLAIKRITPRYSAPTYLSRQGDDVRMDRLYPYAVVEAEAELGPGDTETVWLYCPVTGEGLNRASHKGGEFGVYPSALFEKRMKEEKGGHPN